MASPYELREPVGHDIKHQNRYAIVIACKHNHSNKRKPRETKKKDKEKGD